MSMQGERREDGPMMAALTAIMEAIRALGASLNERIAAHDERHSDKFKDIETRMRIVEEWKAGLKAQLFLVATLGGVAAGIAEVLITKLAGH